MDPDPFPVPAHCPVGWHVRPQSLPFALARAVRGRGEPRLPARWGSGPGPRHRRAARQSGKCPPHLPRRRGRFTRTASVRGGAVWRRPGSRVRRSLTCFRMGGSARRPGARAACALGGFRHRRGHGSDAPALTFACCRHCPRSFGEPPHSGLRSMAAIGRHASLRPATWSADAPSALGRPPCAAYLPAGAGTRQLGPTHRSQSSFETACPIPGRH